MVLNNIYVFYGPENFMLEQEKKKIIKQVLGSNLENNISKYNMLQTNIDEVLEDACTISLFSTKKVIVCYNCYFLTALKSEEEVTHNIDNLIKYIGNVNENTTIIFMVDDKVDERKKVVKQLRQNAVVKEFAKLTENNLINYAKDLFEESGYKIDNKTIRLLVNRVHNNLDILFQEINKLMLYKLEEKVIIEVDVEELIGKQINDNIFELTDAVVKRDLETIFTIYDDILLRNEEPIKIIVILANQFRLIYQVKRLKKLGTTEKEIATQLGVHPYRVKLAGEVSLSEKLLLSYLEKLADLDIGIKTGQVNKNAGLELFFLQL